MAARSRSCDPWGACGSKVAQASLACASQALCGLLMAQGMAPSSLVWRDAVGVAGVAGEGEGGGVDVHELVE